MKHKVYSIHDGKIEAYGPPFLAVNYGHALRQIQNWMENKDHPYSRWPADFTIFEIGDYDDEKGRHESYQANINKGCLIEHKQELTGAN